MTSRAVSAALGLTVACTAWAGCRPRDEVVRIHREGSEGARAVAAVDFSQQITTYDNFVLRPDEFAGATPDPKRGLIYVGSRDGTLLALRDEDGAVAWEVELGGAVSGRPVLGELEDGGAVLLVGTDNGSMHAIDVADRHMYWVYETPGRIRRPAVVHEQVVYFVNSRDQVYALDLRTGAWRWQYEQDFVNDFTVLGHAGLSLVAATGSDTADEAGVVYTGFNNGKVVALGSTSGEPLWLSSVAPPEGGDFIDCDSTPLVDTDRGELWVTGQSTGVYSLATEDGSVGWTFPMRGAGSVVRGPDGALLVASSLEGMVSLDPSGTMRWRTVADPGVLSDPIVVDGTVFVTHSEVGLLAFDYDDGELLAQLRTGSGMASTPVYDATRSRLYAVSNRGTLVALRVGDAVDEPFASLPTP